MTQNTFSTKGVTKVYDEGRSAIHALRGVDLDIPQGEIVVLLGPSGRGKSTLLNIICGLDRATEGDARDCHRWRVGGLPDEDRRWVALIQVYVAYFKFPFLVCLRARRSWKSEISGTI